jgi:hypothetical protein
VQKEVEPEAQTDVLAAIDRLESQLKPREITDISMKTAVLRRLSAIVDSSIASVLEQIARDLEAAA